MAQLSRALILASTFALSLTGCANQPFRAAVARLGTQTDLAMKAQSTELGLVVAGERTRIRSTLADSRASLRFNDECGLAPATAEESFAPCALKVFVSSTAGSTDVATVIDVSNITALQDALASYGANLALLAGSASDDNRKFAEAAAGLATSVGKLDGAITKVAGGDRTVSDANLGIVASAIAKIAGIVFALEREHALKEIIRSTDPFVQRAITLLDQTDRQNMQILAAQATRTAALQMNAYNRAAASPNSDTATRQAAINTLFDSVEGINTLTRRKSQIIPLGRVHSALALAASPSATRKQMALAIEQLIKWNSGQSAASQSAGE